MSTSLQALLILLNQNVNGSIRTNVNHDRTVAEQISKNHDRTVAEQISKNHDRTVAE